MSEFRLHEVKEAYKGLLRKGRDFVRGFGKREELDKAGARKRTGA